MTACSSGAISLIGDARDKYALLSHNRDVALFRHGELVELGIRRSNSIFLYDRKTIQQTVMTKDDEELRNAVSIFQEGRNIFLNGQYKLQ